MNALRLMREGTLTEKQETQKQVRKQRSVLTQACKVSLISGDDDLL